MFTVFAVSYVVWVFILSLHNMGLVTSRYSLAKQRLEPAQIEKIALQELTDQCSKEKKRSSKRSTKEDVSVEGKDSCLSWPQDVVLEHQKTVKIRLLDEKKKSGRKLILFCFTFLVFFLFLPLFSLYWLLVFIIYMATGTSRPGEIEKKK